MTEARFLGHDEDVKRGARLECIHQPQEAGSLEEFCARDAVIGVDMLVGHGPVFLERVRLAVLDLARDGPSFVGHAGWLGAFSCIRWQLS